MLLVIEKSKSNYSQSHIIAVGQLHLANHIIVFFVCMKNKLNTKIIENTKKMKIKTIKHIYVLKLQQIKW